MYRERVVYKVISKGKVSIGNLEDLTRSLLYCPSHVGILRDEDGKMIRTVRCFGKFSHFKPKGKDVERDVVKSDTGVEVREKGNFTKLS